MARCISRFHRLQGAERLFVGVKDETSMKSRRLTSRAPAVLGVPPGFHRPLSSGYNSRSWSPGSGPRRDLAAAAHQPDGAAARDVMNGSPLLKRIAPRPAPD